MLRTAFVLVAAAAAAPVTYRCPLDGTKFKAQPDVEGAQTGTRLDLKPLGPTPAPWTVPVCPKDHYPLVKERPTDAEKKVLRKLVARPDYQALAKDHPSYFLV